MTKSCISTIIQRSIRTRERRCFSNNRINITVVSAESEYLYGLELNLTQPDRHSSLTTLQYMMHVNSSRLRLVLFLQGCRELIVMKYLLHVPL